MNPKSIFQIQESSASRSMRSSVLVPEAISSFNWIESIVGNMMISWGAFFLMYLSCIHVARMEDVGRQRP